MDRISIDSARIPCESIFGESTPIVEANMSLTDLALLATEILLACISLCCLLLGLYFTFGERQGNNFSQEDREEEEKFELMKRKIAPVCSGIFVATAAFAYNIHLHLASRAPETFVFFGVWYAIGLISRFVILTLRHEVMSPIAVTDWDAVACGFFKAILGPIEVIALIRELRR